ncbi:hypothetical protein [Bradyrhizobium sp. sBnM-33]
MVDRLWPRGVGKADARSICGPRIVRFDVATRKK